MNNVKLTPWFPPHIEPARTGIYLATVNKGETFYRHWDGASWLIGGSSPREAATAARRGIPCLSPIHWRGLAEQPK